MDIKVNAGLLDQIRHLVSENESLKGRLGEYQYNTSIKEIAIQELRLQIASSNETKSRFDNQAMELELLQNYMGDMEQEITGAENWELDLHQQARHGIGLKHQFDDLKQQYIFLQTQLTDLQTQLQESKKRNLLLQQESSRIAELESLLADAEQERDEWKALSAFNEQK